MWDWTRTRHLLQAGATSFGTTVADASAIQPEIESAVKATSVCESAVEDKAAAPITELATGQVCENARRCSKRSLWSCPSQPMVPS